MVILIWRANFSTVVEVVSPARGTAVAAVYATGTVEASVTIPISARIMARLIELNVDEGSTVKKGQQLARLEDDDLQHALNALEAQKVVAQKFYNREVSLIAKGYDTKAALDRAKADLDATQAQVARAQAELKFMQLIAPADGLVIQRDGEIGQMIAANQPILWLSCCAPLRVSAEVDEEDIAKVKIKQSVLIRADAFPGKIFHGLVQNITPKGNPIARSYRVRIRLIEATPLQIGMTTESNIILEQHAQVLLLPNTAIVDHAVWQVRSGNLVKQAVKLGIRGVDKSEIISGVNEKDLIVLMPKSTLKEGQHVRWRVAPVTN